MDLDETAPVGEFTQYEADAMQSIQSDVIEKEDFELLLMDYREKPYKHVRSCMISNSFMKDFTALNAHLKECVIAHVLIINRAKRPYLLGNTCMYKHSMSKHTLPEHLTSLDDLSDNKPFHVIDIGCGYRMIFEYEHYRELIKYISITKTGKNNVSNIILPDMDDWGDADEKWIAEHLKSLEDNAYERHGFISYAALKKERTR